MWQMLSAYWPTGESDPSGPPETREFARYWNAGEHIVFSRTLQTVDHGACLVHDNVVDVVRQLQMRRRERHGRRWRCARLNTDRG